MSKLRVIQLSMPDGGEAGVIRAQLAGDPTWTEFRGAPYSHWKDGDDSPMIRLHDALPGWHATVLHQDAVLEIMPRKHAHYATIAAMVVSGG